jgi:hypothetical protein
MNSVSLVFTVHEEIGLANVSELGAILERIQPQVIVLEVPLVDFTDCCPILQQLMSNSPSAVDHPYSCPTCTFNSVTDAIRGN